MHTEHAPRHSSPLRYLPLGLAAAALLLLLGAEPVTAQKKLKEVDIDCARGDSITRALGRPDTELVIHIRGICTEDVVVRRDNVTLLGADPVLDGIRAATVDDSYGAALLLRGVRRVTVENLQISGGKFAGLMIEDSRRGVKLRNLQIENNREVGFRASNSLVVGYDLSVSGNGIAGIGLSETAYLRCTNCTVADNPSADSGYGIVGSAGALMTLIGGSISGWIPISFRFNSVADLRGTDLTGVVSIHAQGNASVTARAATIDGSLLAEAGSRIELNNSRQVYNPTGAGNVITGASYLSVNSQTTLVGKTVFDDFSSGLVSPTASLESMACGIGSDAVCEPGATMTSSSCGSC